MAGTPASHVRLAALLREEGRIDEAIAEVRDVTTGEGMTLLSELYRELGQEEASISVLKQLESQEQLDSLRALFPGLEIVAFDDLLGDARNGNGSKFVEGTNILRFDFGFAKPKEKRTISGTKRKMPRRRRGGDNSRSPH